MSNDEAIAAIVHVVRTYVGAMTAGDRVSLERVFFENASEVGHYEGDLLWNSRDAFISMCEEEAGNAPAYVDWTIRGSPFTETLRLSMWRMTGRGCASTTS